MMMSMRHIFLALSLAVTPYISEGAITLPKIVKSNMVLQQASQKAQVWGWTDDLASPINVLLFCQSGFAGTYQAILEGTAFSAEVGPVDEGEVCSLDIVQGNATVSLTNILFGDIWVCSGQSNMEWPMNSILDSAQEIAASFEFDNIRMYKLPTMTSPTEQDDLLYEDWNSWRDPKQTGAWEGFSAVCFLFARSISERIGKKPFGLVETNWGGTRIEPWSPPESLATCQIPANIDEAAPYNSNSYLYNAMIHPLIKMSIKGALWYQGEANLGWNEPQYPCTFSEMINAWRQRWSQNSPTPADFPFGFCQLASWRENHPSYEFPLVRWHQSMDMGYVPNDIMQNVFMAVTLDTHDPESGIHPRNKVIVGDRMAISGLNVAYGMTEFPSNGPFVASIVYSNAGTASFSARVTYDKEFNYSPVENSGFFTCNRPGGLGACSANPPGSGWLLLPTGSVVQASPTQLVISLPQDATGLSYLWTESPVLGTRAAPIYASDEYQLPGAPWQDATTNV